MPEPFKNLISPATVEAYAQALPALAPGFDADAFRAATLPHLEARELKDRVRLLADALHAHLPGPYPQALAALLGLVGPPADLEQKNQFAFQLWPVTDFVERYGLSHPEASLDALHTLTQRFSGEFAIRPYLLRHRDLTLARLHTWTEDPSPHVRRLVSEGTRARLPWGQRLQPFIDDPAPVLALLEALRADPHPYVRRSVANNLNDLSKDHPARVVATCDRWLQQVQGPQTRALVDRALRGLVKQGRADALALHGAGGAEGLALTALTVSPRVVLGGQLELDFTVHNPHDAPVPAVIDLVLHFRKADGSLRPKVFKGTRLDLPPGARAVHKRLPLRPVTTRRHQPGTQRVEVQVNGRVLGGADFELELGDPG